jgi:anthranilate phosphoribosyltransferase
VKEVLARLVARVPIDAASLEEAVGQIMDGQATPAQIGAFLAALHMRGESAADLAAAVRAVRARARCVSVRGPLLDTCGTGGDGRGTFNISTAVSFVAAAAGVRVAKHGNRAASGKVGAADVLEAVGARIEIEPEAAARMLESVGITFLFAPLYHPAFKHVAGPRRELGFRTVFNLIGPLCNPAGATHQLLGLFSREWMRPVAEALATLGCHRALVVHGSDGSDEITTLGPTATIEVREGGLVDGEIDPARLGIARPVPADLDGGDAAANAHRIRELFAGKEDRPACDVVALNAGAALYVAGRYRSIADGLSASYELIRSGAVLAKLDAFVEASRGGVS